MRFLSIFALAAASCALSSAATVTFNCTDGGNNTASFANGAGAANFACQGFAAPSGLEITAISVLGRVDYQFGTDPGPNTVQVSFALPALFSPNPLNVQNSGGESSVGIAQSPSNLGGGLPTLSYANFNVMATSSMLAGAVNASSARLSVTYTYEQQSGVPEPSTLALVGGVMILAGIRKFRR